MTLSLQASGSRERTVAEHSCRRKIRLRNGSRTPNQLKATREAVVFDAINYFKVGDESGSHTVHRQMPSQLVNIEILKS